MKQMVSLRLARQFHQSGNKLRIENHGNATSVPIVASGSGWFRKLFYFNGLRCILVDAISSQCHIGICQVGKIVTSCVWWVSFWQLIVAFELFKAIRS